MTQIWIDPIYIAAIAIVAVVGWLALVMYYTKIKKWAPEAQVIAYCRKNGNPLIESVGGGRVLLSVGKKTDKGDILFKTDDGSTRIDSRVLGREPPSIARGGLQWLHYSRRFPFNTSPETACALISIIEHVRTNYPELGFIGDTDIIKLVSTPAPDIEHDCSAFIDPDDPQMTTDMLTGKIENIIDETGDLPIKFGPFTFEKGVLLNPSLLLGDEIKVMMAIIRTQVLANYKSDMNDYVKYGTAIMFVLIGAGVFAKLSGVM